jgi:hypothetical protein
MSWNATTILLLVAMSTATLPAAQEQAKPAIEEREFRAVRVTKPPAVDGNLDDEAWSAAPEITGFTQRDPDEGKPATETTVVKVVYDDDAIYFGARMDDRKPVTTLLGRRDTQLESDWFRVYLDPQFDRRSGASFWVNPANVQFDMVIYNDGWDDPDWDAVWESQTKTTASGWTAEMRIPYSQLRFPARAQHTWGIQLVRHISRNNESDRLVHIPKNESGFVSRFARLSGIEGIRPKRALELMPYGVTRSDLRGTVGIADPLNSYSEFKADAGLDVKYGVTSNLTLTGTLNPDFGQVEVDPAQVNLSAFELFFPEKRPFFIEGANLFEFGQGGSNNNFNFSFYPPILFYSRRIGRAPQGTGDLTYDYLSAPNETTILGAGKITGKTGNGWTVAALDALTDAETARFTLGDLRDDRSIEPMTNYLVTRIAKDLGRDSQGRVGTLFTAVNRDLPDDLGFLREEAYLAGIDGYWFFGKKDWILEWFLAGTDVTGSPEAISNTQQSSAHYFQRPDASHVTLDENRTSLSGYGGRITLAKQTGKFRYNFQAQSLSPGFEINDIGYLQRADATATHAAVMYDDREPKGNRRSLGFWAGKWQNWNWDGDLISNGVGGSGYVVWKNYIETWGEVFGSFDRLDDRATRGGPLMKRLPDVWLAGGVITDTRKKISFNAKTGHIVYDEAGVSEHDYNIGVTYRPTSNLRLSVNPSYNVFHDTAQYVATVPDSAATSTYGNRYVFADIDRHTLEISTRADWTFNAKLTFQLYLQPFVASGDYRGFKELAAPRTRDFVTYDGAMEFNPVANEYTVVPDDTRSTSAFILTNPDFNFRSVRGSAVVRWEFRPGSALYAVWNENRAEQETFGDFRLRRDISSITSIDSDDVFLIKVSYWLPL